ncbi:unnamed protein product [Cyprideis torosa]|uniref:Uncharacterized protein n=1 Tax=Cyprideis torosa TaxID=163714 RepID=A0A7R8X2Y0_9CRUS|nr:unnamed protein product [Cyprideis torosa]CAG0912092.1 unnamed protein product [Cyprideis torosa]
MASRQAVGFGLVQAVSVG